jgi:hypothetical protein
MGHIFMDLAFSHGLYPPPARANWLDGYLDLTQDGAIIAADESILDHDTERFVSELRNAGCGPIAPNVALRPKPEITDNHTAQILRVTLTAKAQVQAPAVETPVLVAEGYSLVVSPHGLSIEATDLRGMRYGMDAVVRMATAGKGLIPACEIHDEPSVPIRGVHLFLPAREDLPFFQRLLEFLARYRYNTIYLEIAAGMEFTSHPEINTAWERFSRDLATHPGAQQGLQESMWFDWKNDPHADLAGGSWLTQAEVRSIVEQAEALHLEIIPEVQSLAHAYWLTTPHPEIAEAQDDPYPDTYCPSNPKSYEILFDCMNEIVDVLQPRTIHIGHDEVYTMHRCPECRKHSAAELFAEDVTRIYGWLAERGIRTVMWCDKLLDIDHPSGERYGGVMRRVFKGKKQWVMPPTASAIDSIPRDVGFVDWYWMLDDRTPELMTERGFSEIVFGNFTPGAMEHWREYRDMGIVKGAELSTWVGASEDILARHVSFPHLFIEGAANLWWTEYDPHAHKNPASTIASKLAPSERERVHGSATLLDTARRSPQQFVPLGLDSEVVEPFLPDGSTLTDLSAGGCQYDGIPFSIPEIDGSPGTVAVRFTDPIQRIHTNIRAGGLIALLGTSIKHPRRSRNSELDLGPDVAGQLRFHFGDENDGDRDRLVMDLIYSGTLFHWGDRPRSYWADPVIEATKGDGDRVVLYAVPWENPWPERIIRSVDLVWRGGRTMEGEICLLGITAQLDV